MYKLLLIRKYLRRKLAPMFAVLAVTICTAMVIIVISVMGGFLSMMRNAARTLTGDVSVMGDLTGFPHYEDLLRRIESLPSVTAAAPLIRSFGLLNLGGNIHTVEVIGIDPPRFDQVTNYADTLHWTKQHYLDYFDQLQPEGDNLTTEQRESLRQRRANLDQLDLRQAGMTFEVPEMWKHYSDPPAKYGIVPGIEINPWNDRDDTGSYSIENAQLGGTVTLTVLPLTQKGTIQAIQPAVEKFAMVNEFKSGLYDIDANRVYVPFAVLQQMLDMHPQQVWDQFDPTTGEPIGEAKTRVGRVTEIMVKGAAGHDADTVKADVRQAVSEYLSEYKDVQPLWVQTWRERHRTLLNAVEKEKGLLTVLFGIISLVAVVMITVIFYMIVLEKTRDIGTLRAIGASQSGIAGIFMGYGLAIGIVGAAMGLALAAAIVTYLNEIQDLLFKLFEFKMWDPRIYYFERIPTRLDPVEVTLIVIVAIVSSLVGSIVPAIIAARLDPVEALRYE